MTTSHHDIDQPKPRVLIVDDEAESCHILGICLDKNNYQINFAKDAQDAFNLMEQEPYDVLVTDVMMPGEDGISLLGRLHKTCPDVPVIVMTGNYRLQMAIDAMKNGAFDFVSKPLEFDHMRIIVDRAVNFSKLLRMEKNFRAELEEKVTVRTLEMEGVMSRLDDARLALSERVNEKNEFMVTLSHEMRTPMHGVMGGLALLEDEVVSAEGKKYLEIARQSADNMAVLIDELLTFRRGIDSN